MEQHASACGNDAIRCRNCDTPLAGRWCHACGQKRFEHDDRRLTHLLRQLVEAATDLDSRFWRSLRALLLEPGRLSRDYLDGRRQRWMSPVTLFLLASLLYFVAPGLSDFELPFADQVPGRLRVELHPQPAALDDALRARMEAAGGQWHSPWTAALVEARVAERDAAARAADPSARYTLRDYARAYDARVGEVSKLLVAVHLPLIAAVLALLFARRRLLFAEHVVVATHLFAFLLIAIQLMTVPAVLLMQLAGLAALPPWWLPAFAGLLGLHGALTLHRVYAVPRWLAPLLAVLLFVLLGIGSLAVYRALQFLLVFALT